MFCLQSCLTLDEANGAFYGEDILVLEEEDLVKKEMHEGSRVQAGGKKKRARGVSSQLYMDEERELTRVLEHAVVGQQHASNECKVDILYEKGNTKQRNYVKRIKHTTNISTEILTPEMDDEYEYSTTTTTTNLPWVQYNIRNDDINSIPLELLEIIISFLTSKSRESLELTCKRYKQVCQCVLTREVIQYFRLENNCMILPLNENPLTETDIQQVEQKLDIKVPFLLRIILKETDSNVSVVLKFFRGIF